MLCIFLQIVKHSMDVFDFNRLAKRVCFTCMVSSFLGFCIQTFQDMNAMSLVKIMNFFFSVSKDYECYLVLYGWKKEWSVLIGLYLKSWQRVYGSHWLYYRSLIPIWTRYKKAFYNFAIPRLTTLIVLSGFFIVLSNFSIYCGFYKNVSFTRSSQRKCVF